jgi:hypothetical protein
MAQVNPFSLLDDDAPKNSLPASKPKPQPKKKEKKEEKASSPPTPPTPPPPAHVITNHGGGGGGGSSGRPLNPLPKGVDPVAEQIARAFYSHYKSDMHNITSRTELRTLYDETWQEWGAHLEDRPFPIVLFALANGLKVWVLVCSRTMFFFLPAGPLLLLFRVLARAHQPCSLIFYLCRF